MIEQAYYLNGPVRWSNISDFKNKCNSTLGRHAVTSVSSTGYFSAINLTVDELDTIMKINMSFDVLDSWESSKLRNLTIADLNNRVAAVQSQIDAVTNVATAKTALNSMYVDMQKMARIILWLLKREMNQLD